MISTFGGATGKFSQTSGLPPSIGARPSGSVKRYAETVPETLSNGIKRLYQKVSLEPFFGEVELTIAYERDARN